MFGIFTSNNVIQSQASTLRKITGPDPDVTGNALQDRLREHDETVGALVSRQSNLREPIHLCERTLVQFRSSGAQRATWRPNLSVDMGAAAAMIVKAVGDLRGAAAAEALRTLGETLVREHDSIATQIDASRESRSQIIREIQHFNRAASELHKLQASHPDAFAEVVAAV